MKLFDVFEKFPIHIVRGEGCYIYDDQGNRYLDMYGGHGVISIGHAHPQYVSNLSQQLSVLGFYSNAVESRLQEFLAAKLGEVSGYDDYQVFFSNSGAEANENGLKLASFHTGRKKVLAFSNAFHGRTSAAASATDVAALRAPVNESDYFVFTPFNDIGSLRKQLETKMYCAVIMEGIQGVGGVHIPDDNFMLEVKNICEKTGTLLILDEIQSGYGRTGKFFAHQYAGIRPDLITVAKGMGNGYPIAATCIHPSIKATKGMLGSTYGGNQLGCMAALTVLDVMVQEQLLENATQVGNYLLDGLQDIPGLIAVRGRGLMIGIEFEDPIEDFREQLLIKNSIFTGSSGRYTIRLLPPLSFTKQQARVFLDTLKEIYADSYRTQKSSDGVRQWPVEVAHNLSHKIVSDES